MYNFFEYIVNKQVRMKRKICLLALLFGYSGYCILRTEINKNDTKSDTLLLVWEKTFTTVSCKLY